MQQQRVDIWLWQARFFKTRSLAKAQIAQGKLRINGVRVSKPAHAVKIGDQLSFKTGDWLRVIEVAGFNIRRGPAPEAQATYLDHSDERPKRVYVPIPTYEGKGRPTGKDRRKLDRVLDQQK